MSDRQQLLAMRLTLVVFAFAVLAYAIALRTGFVPTVGEPSEHPLYARPVTATIPMAGYVVPSQTGPVVPGTVIAQPEQTAALPLGCRRRRGVVPRRFFDGNVILT